MEIATLYASTVSREVSEPVLLARVPEREAAIQIYSEPPH